MSDTPTANRGPSRRKRPKATHSYQPGGPRVALTTTSPASPVPRLHSTIDVIFSLLTLAATPMILLMKWIFDRVSEGVCGRGRKWENKQNVSSVDGTSDAALLKLNKTSHVLTTIAGGCHVLEYLLHGGRVTAVAEDMYQVALLELKTVSILHLPFDQFFAIFGQSNMKLLNSVYQCSLRMHLTVETANYWDKELPHVSSFMYAGGVRGYISWFIFRYLLTFIGLGFIRTDLRAGTAAPALCNKMRGYKFRLQMLAYMVDCFIYRVGLCFPSIFGRGASLGVSRADNVSTIVEKIFFQSDLVDENYVIAGYILGEYTKQNAPKYMHQEMNYYSLRIALNERRLRIVHGTLLSALDETNDVFSSASLLFKFDDMTARDINTLLTHLIPHMDPDNGRILWRSVAKKVHAAPLALLRPKTVVDSRDRLGGNWTSWVADISSCPVTFEPRCYNVVAPQSTISGLITGFQMVTFCLWKPFVSMSEHKTGHAQLMESFFKYQRDGYDQFREHMLHARPLLMTAIPLKKGEEMTWVDVGGGTARVLEYFDAATIRKYFKKIFIIDVSSSLLDVARERIRNMKLEGIVQVIEEDFTSVGALSAIPIPLHTVDIITFSYSLSMIAKQAAAIENSSKLLKRNGEGILAIADFFDSCESDRHLPAVYSTLRSWERIIHKRWFAVDNVKLISNSELKSIKRHMNCLWDERFRGDVPFVPFLKPFQGMVMYQTKT